MEPMILVRLTRPYDVVRGRRRVRLAPGATLEVSARQLAAHSDCMEVVEPVPVSEGETEQGPAVATAVAPDANVADEPEAVPPVPVRPPVARKSPARGARGRKRRA